MQRPAVAVGRELRRDLERQALMLERLLDLSATRPAKASSRTSSSTGRQSVIELTVGPTRSSVSGSSRFATCDPEHDLRVARDTVQHQGKRRCGKAVERDVLLAGKAVDRPAEGVRQQERGDVASLAPASSRSAIGRDLGRHGVAQLPLPEGARLVEGAALASNSFSQSA